MKLLPGFVVICYSHLSFMDMLNPGNRLSLAKSKIKNINICKLWHRSLF